MRARRWIGSLIIAISAASLATAAFADIPAFNAAVKAGDYKKAAAEAKAIWSTWDKADRDTAVLAREFGFASYVSGDYAAAQMFGQFLKDNGATLATPDDQPATSRVLLAAASFRLKSEDATRKDLLDALKAREAAAGVDNVSVLAAEALYKADWAAGAWDKASESSGLAWRLLGRAGPGLSYRALDARAAFATSGFLSGPDKADYDNIADAHDAVVAEINAALNPQKRLSFAPMKYQLEAWAMSVGSYFHSGQQTGTNIPINVKQRELAKLDQPMFPESVLTGDQCQKADLQWPIARYPTGALYRNMVGSVIMKMDTDEAGRVTKWEVLAAVPARHFSKAVEDSVPNIYWKRTSADKPDCSLKATSRVAYFMFGRL